MSLIPIFPLPNVVLFPNVFLPLHIFENRYLEMVHDALAGDRIIGMVLLHDGWEDDDDGAVPAVYRVGCSGLITHCERLADRRYNLVLRGLEKFRILDEDHSRHYRQASIEPINEPSLAASGLCEERQRLERRLTSAGSDSKVPREMADADLVNALSQYLEFSPLEKQALLERDGLLDRCRSLGDLLEMNSLIANGSFPHTNVQ